MIEARENLARSDKRIVAVSKWRNPPTIHHLTGIYYRNWIGYDRGCRNFFNDHLNIMTVAQAQNHLVWKVSADGDYQTFARIQAVSFITALEGLEPNEN